jgi:hypothetical protein
MSKFVEINFNPSRETLRQFGFIAVGAFGLLAALAWYERAVFSFGLGTAREAVALAFVVLAGVSLIGSLVLPAVNRILFVGLSVISFPIGLVLSYVILGTLFFVVFGLFAILLRVFRSDAMKRAYDPTAPSYWAERSGAPERERYFKQF